MSKALVRWFVKSCGVPRLANRSSVQAIQVLSPAAPSGQVFICVLLLARSLSEAQTNAQGKNKRGWTKEEQDNETRSEIGRLSG